MLFRSILRQIMSGDYWKELRKRWNALQVQVKSDFNKPVKMKVFAYTCRAFQRLRNSFQ